MGGGSPYRSWWRAREGTSSPKTEQSLGCYHHCKFFNVFTVEAAPEDEVPEGGDSNLLSSTMARSGSFKKFFFVEEEAHPEEGAHQSQ